MRLSVLMVCKQDGKRVLVAKDASYQPGVQATPYELQWPTTQVTTQATLQLFPGPTVRFFL